MLVKGVPGHSNISASAGGKQWSVVYVFSNHYRIYETPKPVPPLRNSFM